MSHPISKPVLRMVAAAVGALGLCLSGAAQDKKLTVEEVVSRHLDAIGSAQARAAAKTRAAGGAVVWTSRVGRQGSVEGQALMVSEAPKMRYIMRFPTLNDISDEMAFDGERTATSLRPTGGRSLLNQFLDLRNTSLKEGLIGGVLSTAWPLLRLEQQQPKLDYQGLKKVNDKPMHKLGYKQRKGLQDLKVTLYFDAETFRHTRSEYEVEIGARVGTRLEDSARGSEIIYKLVEEFDDFRVVDGLTLPHKYRLQLAITGPNSTLNDWALTVSQLIHNKAFDEQTFKVK